LALKFFSGSGEQRSILKAPGGDLLIIGPRPLRQDALNAKIDFRADAWPDIERFLRAALVATNLPRRVEAETTIKVDTEVEEIKLPTSLDLQFVVP
jgi:hypothetical protein